MTSSQKQKHLCEDFLNAVIYGDKKKLLLCLKKGANINHTGGNGSSALHRAALNEQPQFVKLLLERGIDCNLKNLDRESALHSATSNKKTDITKLLIENGINCNIQDRDGKSALHHATLNRKADIVKELIDGCIDLNLKDKGGSTALHAAMEYGYTKIANLLICATGINLNLKNKDGLTALHAAMEYGYTNIANLLIGATGIDLNLQKKDGSTALHIATKKGNTKILQLLINKDIDMNIKDTDGLTALHAAMEYGYTNIANLLICATGMDLNLQNKVGSTALHIATIKGNTKILQLLINKDINMNIQNMDGWTALHSGAWYGKADIMHLLIKKGMCVNLKTNNGSSALHLAANRGNTDIAHMLIDHDIAINLQDNDGSSALHHAAWNGRTEFAKILLDRSIDLNLQAKNGFTALHDCALYENKDIMQLLIDKDIDLNLQTEKGNTALHIVAEKDSVQWVSYMLDSNCDPNIVNSEGKKPIELTSYRPNRRLFKVFEKTLLPGLPVEVKKFDRKSAQVFASLLEQENYPHYESRVMLVGEHGTGKTTIARYLVGKSPTKPKTKSTDGIELTNGLSYIDRESRTWLVGEQEFSLEEIATSRSLLHKVRRKKSVNAISIGENNLIPDLKHPKSNHQLKTGPNKADIASTSQASIETVRALNDPKDPDDAFLKSDSSDDTHTQTITITQPGPLRRLKNFFGVTRRVEEVKVTITKDKFFQMVSKVGKKMLHKKKIAPVIIWDFGGQDVFYSTHQTFLTYRALYMIVMDGSRNLDDPVPYEQYLPGQSGDKTAKDYLRFWIKTIVTYCKGSVDDYPKIMIVLTHKDKIQSHEAQEDRKLEIFSEIRHMFEHTPFKNHIVIDDMIFVNAKDKNDSEMKKITNVIRSESEKQPTWGEPLPKCFITLELEFASLIKRNIPLITLEHLNGINSAQSIRPLSNTELKVFLKFQHSIGKILYFDEEKLNTHVILSPTFLIDAFKSIVTDRKNCEGDTERVKFWEIMGETGVVSKKAIQQIWKKKQYREFYKNKDYLLDVMTHLDILVEPTRYDSNHTRIPAEFYYVASMVRANDDSGYLQSADLEHKSIAIVFQSSSLMIPPALSFRFLSNCLSVWAVKKFGQNNKTMLFYRSGVFTIDAALDMFILCEDDRIIVRLVHAHSNTLIARDIASSINDCLTSALEKISQLYIRISSNQNHTSDAFFITNICCNSPINPCILEVNKLAQKGIIWKCPSHGIEHQTHTLTSWFPGKDQNICQPGSGCPVTNEEFLRVQPSDLHLRRLSLLYTYNEIRELAIGFGMSYTELDNISHTNDTEILNFEIVRKCRDKFSLTFKRIKDACMDGNIVNTHRLCKLVKGGHIGFAIEPKWDVALTEKHIDRLAPLIGKNSLHFLIELEMEFKTWEQISHSHITERDLVKLNKDILEKWRTDFCKERGLKPTLRIIAQAFKNIDKDIQIVEQSLSNMI
ncbi:uncharacterized protein [Mytilus edulis]|uniref:uncharacterized protein n=1 Tax=Mytilus edulis TaxID=6550 RepID=UPI0039F03A0A